MSGTMRSIACLLILPVILEMKLAQAECDIPQRIRNVLRTVVPEQSRGPVEEHSIIEHRCKPGYERERGDPEIICVKGRWMVIKNDITRRPHTFQCKKKLCPVSEILHGKMEIANNKYVTYRCDRGFQLKGFPSAECRLNEKGEFYITSPLSSCELLPICEQPDAPNLQTKGNCCFKGDQVTFFCDRGYKLEGVSSAVCLPTGNWNETSPSCTRIKQCDEPSIPKHGNWIGGCCEVGSELTYECDNGYELVHHDDGNSIKCQSNEEWSAPPPLCKPVGEIVCPNIPFEENNLIVRSNLSLDRDVFLVDDEVDLDCKPGHYTEYDETYLMCMDDGAWDSPIPVCKPKKPCSRPPSPSYGRISQLIENPTQDKFPVLYEMVMECDEGYTSQNGRFGSICLGNNVWSYHLNCTRITCSNPGLPPNGQRIGNDFHYNSNITFICMGSYQLIGSDVRTCQENGRWSGYTTICDAGDSDCLDPGVPINSYRKGDSFNIGDIVTYSCRKRTTMIGNGSRECLDGEDGAYWSGSEIECRSQSEFTDKEDAALMISETMTMVSRSSIQSSSSAQFARSAVVPSKSGVSGTDLFFAFDGSGSITDLEFGQAKDFAITLIRQVGISHGYGGVRVAVIVFSKQSVEVVQMAAKTVGQVTRDLQNMKRKKEGTDISAALQKLTELAVRSRESMPNRKKIAFVLTDGLWNQGGDPKNVASALRNPYSYNVEVYAIGIGKPRNLGALLHIAGDKNRVLLFETHDKLVSAAAKAIARDIDYSACGLERPSFLNDTSTKGNRRKTVSQKLIRIVGGKEVERPWPWMAALAKNTAKGYATQCGGSIIHHEWILTAAHCFKTDESHVPKASDWQVIVGATDLTTANGWNLRVANITLHDQYDTETLDNDIALVKLKNPVPYDLYIRPICLPPVLNDIPANTELYHQENTATVIGYGHTEVMQFGEDGSTVDHLKELDVRLQPDKVCQKTVEHGNLRREPTPQMICAGSGKGKEDACKGDSGGPLMQLANSVSRNDTQERWYVIGVNSWGVGCGLENYYGYYSYVAKLRQWIERVTQVEFENAAPLPKQVARG